MVGRLKDSILLAGVGTGNMLFNICGYSIFIGVNGTLETFIPQTFGSGKKRECGVELNRARVINLVLFIPIAILMCFTGDLLVLFY